MRASLLLLAAAAVLSCRVTEVALVTVRNDTRADVAVRVRLPGSPTFRDDLMLKPTDERTILKYEEQKSAAQALPSLVDGLQVVVGPCMGTLDTADVARAAVRTEHPRRWTVLVTPAVLRASGCPSP
jgi:hypothetical protein